MTGQLTTAGRDWGGNLALMQSQVALVRLNDLFYLILTLFSLPLTLLLITRDKMSLGVKPWAVTRAPRYDHPRGPEATFPIPQWQPNNEQQERSQVTALIFPCFFCLPLLLPRGQCCKEAGRSCCWLPVCLSSREHQRELYPTGCLLTRLCIERQQHRAGQAGSRQNAFFFLTLNRETGRN